MRESKIKPEGSAKLSYGGKDYEFPVFAGSQGPNVVDIRKLYDQYVDARRRNNESTDNVRYETVAESVKKMVPKLREKHGDKKIDFEVVVQNGRVGLRPKIE